MNELKELIIIWEQAAKDWQLLLGQAKQDMIELIRWDKECSKKLLEAEQTLAYLKKQKK